MQTLTQRLLAAVINPTNRRTLDLNRAKFRAGERNDTVVEQAYRAIASNLAALAVLTDLPVEQLVENAVVGAELDRG